MADFDYMFLIEVLVGGLLSGVMYSLVAIGFVLIYKTSGVLNFAQGSLLLFAALTFVSLTERGVPFAGSLALTLVVMFLLGWRSSGLFCGPWSISRRLPCSWRLWASPTSLRGALSSSGARKCTGSISASKMCPTM